MPDAPRKVRPNEDIVGAAKGGGISVAGRLFAWGARLAMAVLLARLLGADEYGLYNLALTAVAVVASLPSLGLDSALIRFTAVYAARRDTARLRGSMEVGIGLPLILSLVAGLVLFGAAEIIATGVMHDERLTPLIQIASILVPATVLNRQLGAALQGLRRLGDAVRAEQFAQPASRIVILLLMALVGLTAAFAVAASVIAAGVATLLLVLLLARAVGAIRGTPGRRELGTLANHAAPVYFSNIVTTFGANLQTLFLGALSTATSVGIFAIANQVTLVGSMFHASVVASSMPYFAEMADRGDRAGLKRLYRTTSKWTFTLNLPLFCLVLAFPASLLSIFGREFEAGVPALVILAWGSLVNAATGTSGAILDMAGHTRVKLINAALSLGLAIGLNWLLIPSLGVVGAAIAAVGSIAVVNLLRLAEVGYLVRIAPYDVTWLKPVAAAIVATAAGIGAAWLAAAAGALVAFAAGVVTLLAIYVAMILVLRLSEEDRMVLGRAGRRLARIRGPRPRRRGSPSAGGAASPGSPEPTRDHDD